MVAEQPWHYVIKDIQNRRRVYADDWKQGWAQGIRILAPAVYIFCASVLPALAFGQQLSQSTDGTLNVVHVLASTAIAGVIQAVLGGQPLLIIGVAEPIVIIYAFMYTFASGQQGLGPALFLPWAAWVCCWTALLCLLAALAGACRAIGAFTRCSGETFGALIAVLFMQEGIKGAVREFREPPGSAQPLDRLVNGLWSLLVAAGLLCSSLVVDTARSWRFMTPRVRGFLADYGTPLMVVVWSGLSFALGADAPSGVPRRVATPDTWQVTSTWGVASRMAQVPGSYIAAALLPAAIISVLFYFDHNVSSQMAQQKEYGLAKPPAYHYDLLLLAGMTLLCGLLGLPPVNGVLPQAPMHTRALAALGASSKKDAERRKQQQQEKQQQEKQQQEKQQQGAQAEQAAGDKDTAITNGSTHGPHARPAAAVHKEQQKQQLAVQSAASSSSSSSQPLQLHVVEQRLTNLIQALLCGVALAATPAIKQIPTAALWGYFAYMAIKSLPGNQLWERLLLLATDPRRRRAALLRPHAPYLQTVPFPQVARFTVLQMGYLVGIWALVTFAGVAGIAFPLPIMLLVPLRRYLLPRLFRPEHLGDLDADELLRAQPLGGQQISMFGKPLGQQQQGAAGGAAAGAAGGAAGVEAAGAGAAAGIDPSAVALEGLSADGGLLAEEPDVGELLAQQFVGQQVVHELSQEQLVQREMQLRGAGQQLPR